MTRPGTTSSAQRRARPTIRCLTEDLGLTLPDLNVDLGEINDPWLDELRRIAPTSPEGQKRILSVASPVVYRLRVSDERGATWVDDEHGIVWLLAVRRREQGSDDDAFSWFASLHASERLFPDEDDVLRDRAEAVLRFHKLLTRDLLQLADSALATVGKELVVDLGEWLACRMLVLEEGGLQEIWCALSTRGSDGDFVAERQRDLLFAELERYVQPAIFEARSDWPTGDAEWWEVVRFGVR
ncbi:MAG: hypothetical protein ACLPYW_12365 [Acidimicrobiales bacterium]